MFANTNERPQVERELTALNIHPEEVQRLADLGDTLETIGQELVAALAQQRVGGWLIRDIDDRRYLTTDSQQPAALALEAAMVAGIVAPASVYTNLYIGGTDIDAPLQLAYIHVNTLGEDMRFPAQGPRVLIDGRTLPLPDQLFVEAEGYHIPFDWSLTPSLLQEVFRTLRPGGTVTYAPSTSPQEVMQLMLNAGFVNVVSLGMRRPSNYRGRPTYIATTIVAQRP